jgi:hypothetical protein
MPYFRSVLCVVWVLLRCSFCISTERWKPRLPPLITKMQKAPAKKEEVRKWFNSTSVKEDHRRYSHGPKLLATISRNIPYICHHVFQTILDVVESHYFSFNYLYRERYNKYQTRQAVWAISSDRLALAELTLLFALAD